MIRLLVSVRSPDEALLAARGGADFIDLKEPGRGALGDLPLPTIRAIVAALRAAGSTVPISATIGDVAMAEIEIIARRVEAVASCGVDIVKVGIEADHPAATSVLSRLAACGRAIVPVFIAEHGLDPAVVRAAAQRGFPALMVDTADKRSGSLFERLDAASLHAFVAAVRAAGAEVGIAGALRIEQAARIAALDPDFAGFRSAVCAGTRSDALDTARLHALVAALREAAPVGAGPPQADDSPGATKGLRQLSGAPATRRSAARASAPARPCASGRSETRRCAPARRSWHRAHRQRPAPRA